LRENLQFILKGNLMKAQVYVTLKPGVLDPQGKAIHHSAEMMGYNAITDIRQGKYFEIALDPGTTDEQARDSVEKLASDVLANPVIEDFRVDISE